MKKVLAVLIAIIIAFCGGFVVGSLGLVHIGDTDQITIKVLKEEIVKINEIASLKCTTTESGEIRNSKKIARKFDIPFTGKLLTAECNVITRLGSDLSQAEIELSEDGTSAVMTVPHSEILSMEIDEESWALVNNKSGLFNRTTVEDDDQIRKDVKKAAKERIKEGSYLDEADLNTKEIIEAHFASIYPDMTVTVEFQ